MYQKVSADMKFVGREKEIEQFWKDHDIFNKSVSMRKGKETYMFYDGPPTANGKPHIGHVLTRAIKDMIPRYRTMKGYYVPRKAGWDTHGLPVELEVEKEIGISGKDQIEDYGIEPFIKKCRESVWKYKGMWEDFSGTVGFWADMDHPYITYEDDYIESEWWALNEIWKKGLLYKGFKVVPYCPRCGTPLSSHEVAQGYKTVKERSAIVRFKVKDEDAYFLAWTTTPWTLLSNVALCVNPDETYAKVEADDGKVYYMAKPLLDKVLGDGEEKKSYTILSEMTGKDLEYKAYEPLYDCTAEAAAKRKGEKAFFVVCDNYVTMEDGTGIVHIAPAFGEDDARVGRQYGIAFVQMVDEKGVMLDATPFAGMRAKPNEDETAAGVKSADPEIIADLKQSGKLFYAPQFEHDYPHCWRCSTPLLYYARESWFIKMTAVKDDLIRGNRMINWVPQSIGEGRFGDWLENIQDWGISRNRYWGTPLNIWECEGCGHQISVGSREELAKLTGDGSALSVELHRPYIDRYVIKCPECEGSCKRVPEVIDCWFDSGAMPFAQLHYPFENRELFENDWFPASFISEAVDQTRGWFYSLHAISTLLFNKPCFENVIVLGLVQDENGQKMSKSKGNAVDPFEALETYGADAIRWYFYTNSAPWLPSRFSGKAVQEGERKFLSTFWNTYAFFVLYANIDGFDAADYLKPEGALTSASLHEAIRKALGEAQLAVMDKWILSRMNTMLRETDDALDHYRIPEAGKSLLQFTDDLSNWYVRRCRERFWASGMEADKIAAYLTLYACLVNLAQAAAPMTPFIAESVYRNLVCVSFPDAPESVHLTDYPAADEKMTDSALEHNMSLVMEVVVLGRAARNAAAIKNRQPVQTLYVRAGGTAGTQKKHDAITADDAFVNIIRDELNVKEVVFTDDVREFTSYTFKPQLKTLGPKYGKQLNAIRTYLSALDGNTAMDELNAQNVLRFDADGVQVELTKEDLLIDTAQKEGFMSQEENGVTVVLDCNLTPALIEEGFANEVVSKVQTSRKDAGFEVMDRIRLSVTGNAKVIAVVRKNADFIGTKVLADEILYDKDVKGAKEWDINGEKTMIGVEKI